jgi:hypothetical protein
MLGKKRVEYRSRPTHIRERVYVYASCTPAPAGDWARTIWKPGDLPTGVLVGTVEITGCTGEPGDFNWHLAKPERSKRKLKPTNHPQPSWFNPF